MVAPQVESSRAVAWNQAERVPFRVVKRSQSVFPPQTKPQLRSPSYSPTSGVLLLQTLRLTLCWSSQPLLVFASQVEKPGLQLLNRQEPVEQEVDALVREQVVPQAPQLELVVMLVSHPLVWLPSQLANPELQEAMLHAPEAQVAEALVREQEVPQVPQLVSELREASQPLVLLPSQLASPALQLAIWQEPVPQVAVAPVLEQEAPHDPQLERVLTGVSQPLEATPSQFPNPEAQLAI
jgi:hypothetical protein